MWYWGSSLRFSANAKTDLPEVGFKSFSTQSTINDTGLCQDTFSLTHLFQSLFFLIHSCMESFILFGVAFRGNYSVCSLEFVCHRMRGQQNSVVSETLA